MHHQQRGCPASPLLLCRSVESTSHIGCAIQMIQPMRLSLGRRSATLITGNIGCDKNFKLAGGLEKQKVRDNNRSSISTSFGIMTIFIRPTLQRVEIMLRTLWPAGADVQNNPKWTFTP